MAHKKELLSAQPGNGKRYNALHYSGGTDNLFTRSTLGTLRPGVHPTTQRVGARGMGRLKRERRRLYDLINPNTCAINMHHFQKTLTLYLWV